MKPGVDVCLSSGKRALSASVGSSSLQEHYHPQPETGWSFVSTPSQSSSFYHTDAANTAGTSVFIFSFSSSFALQSLSSTNTPSDTELSQTNIHDWCRVREEGKLQQMEERGAEGYRELFLQGDLTGSNLSVNTEHSNLPMTTQCPSHPACVWKFVSMFVRVKYPCLHCAIRPLYPHRNRQKINSASDLMSKSLISIMQNQSLCEGYKKYVKCTSYEFSDESKDICSCTCLTVHYLHFLWEQEESCLLTIKLWCRSTSQTTCTIFEVKTLLVSQKFTSVSSVVSSFESTCSVF